MSNGQCNRDPRMSTVGPPHYFARSRASHIDPKGANKDTWIYRRGIRFLHTVTVPKRTRPAIAWEQYVGRSRGPLDRSRIRVRFLILALNSATPLLVLICVGVKGQIKALHLCKNGPTVRVKLQANSR